MEYAAGLHAHALDPLDLFGPEQAVGFDHEDDDQDYERSYLFDATAEELLEMTGEEKLEDAFVVLAGAEEQA